MLLNFSHQLYFAGSSSMGEYVHVLKWLFNKTQHLTLSLGWSYTSLHENIHQSKCKCFNQLPEKLSGKSQIGMDADENNLTTVFALFYDFPAQCETKWLVREIFCSTLSHCAFPFIHPLPAGVHHYRWNLTLSSAAINMSLGMNELPNQLTFTGANYCR